MKRPKTKTIEIELRPVYHIVLTKKVGQYKKGEKLFMIGLDEIDFSKFLGNNGYPFGYSGDLGDYKTSFSKEILENIVVEKEFRKITSTIETHQIKDFKQ
jgi:hypothetical protein